MKRRDFGVKLLQRQGFPVAIAKRLEGQVLASLTLRQTSDRIFLHGHVTNFRIEFSTTPARIDKIQKLPPKPRSYRRVEAIAVKELVSLPGTSSVASPGS